MPQPYFETPIQLYHVLKTSWTEETCCDGWDAQNPCKNQCSVTALAVQHFFGGDIVTTATKGGTHFYNRIDGVYWDLAADQFDEPIPYANTPSSVEAALADSSAAKLDVLLANIARLAV